MPYHCRLGYPNEISVSVLFQEIGPIKIAEDDFWSELPYSFYLVVFIYQIGTIA